MHWETKKMHATRFIVIFTLLQWSRTEPAISKVCLYISSKLLWMFYKGSFFFSFWLHHMACGILVAQPGIKPVYKGSF